MKQLVFFNNKGGVGKTTLVQHLGYALEKQGKRILFVDADPQCNLTSYICNDDQINTFWNKKSSIYNVVVPLISGIGDIDSEISPYQVPGRNIWLLPGDILLSDFEQFLSERWVDVLAGREVGFRVTSSIFRYVSNWAESNSIDYVLVDIGPNLGALNRAILLGCNYFIVPMVPDLFSLRGLSNMGTSFIKWMTDWQGATSRLEEKKFKIQDGKPAFAGYVTSHFNIYRNRETKAWASWTSQIPSRIKTDIVDKLRKHNPELIVHTDGENYLLGEIKNYHSLSPLSQTVLKPIFELTSGDGAKGIHITSVKECGELYAQLSQKIIQGLP